MLKRFSHFFAYLLLLLIPLQGIAAANMLVCNSIMQTEATHMQNMPCHQNANKSEHQNPCKIVCATLCAGLNTIATLPSEMSATNFQLSAPLLNLPNQVYASIIQPNLQRPPIFLT